ncbi:MAG TPA: beta galactosidase jelly roll domain-containing protein [Bacteroidales bacterium]|nr:beta galactosidase jelly roll domain-containing protein [Bacteroidales bacterium]
MKQLFKTVTAIAGLIVLSVMTALSQDSPVRQVKLTDFELQSSSLVQSTGEEISTPQYTSKVYWFPVKVPCTVLTGLVANGIYPDPYAGLNNMLIPDASDEFNKKYNLERHSHLPNDPNPWKKPYWYRTSFNVPAGDQGRHFQLIFKGINYRAGVWLNGKQIADSTQMAGMFAQYSLDVSKIIKPGSENVLAVKIYPLDYPGLPSTEQLEALGDFYPNGGPTGDIGKNVTMLCSVGWDWVPPVRDRNIGIWLPVYLRTTGNVTIADPQIITQLPSLPDTSRAEVSINLKLRNRGEADEKGKLLVSIIPETFKGNPVQFTKDFTINRNSFTQVTLSPENTKELAISNPALWWPNGYGRPDLYRIRLQYSGNNGVTDDTTFLFGVRTVSTKATLIKPVKIDKTTKNSQGFYRRDFYVNGRRIHITGGAWVPDFMLNRDSLRYDYELRLCKNSNINLVRIWGGGVTPKDEFFEAADRYGLLVWSDFWVTGDTQGEFKGSPDWPLEGNVFVKNVQSTILRIRNHPSLLLWTGGNEGHARKELYDVMRESIIKMDGTRPYIPSSSGFAKLPEGFEGAWPDGLPSGVYSGGPYTWQDPSVYYKKAMSVSDWVFKDETGLPSQPPYNIMHKIIPDLVWDKTLPFPLNHTWGYHDAATGNGRWDLYYNEMVKRYGEPLSMEDFSDKMQLLNAIGYQGIFEAAGHRLNDIGGVMLWKLNAAFPSVVWQVYDWFLMPNAGYYFMQNACEPVHIQYNPVTGKVSVINRTYKPYQALTATADIYNLDSKQVFHEEKKIALNATEVRETSALTNALSANKGVNFIVLKIVDQSGGLVSHNTYWLSADGDYKSMNTLQKTSVETIITKSAKGDGQKTWTVKLTNNSDRIAFFIRPQILSNGEEVLPSFWSAGYFTLAPSETRTVQVSCPEDVVMNNAVLQVSGWNVNKTVLQLK